MREQTIQSSILNYLNTNGYYAVKVISASKAGVPDILCCMEGKFVAFEVKAEHGVLSELQKYNINRIGSADGHGFVVTSLAEVKKLISEIIQRN